MRRSATSASSLLVGAAEHGEPAGHRRRGYAGFEQAALAELDVVGGDFPRGDAPDLHVADEIGEVATIRLDRVVGEQGVADPGEQGRGDLVGGAAGGLQGPGQEGPDLVAGGDIAVEERPGGTTAETRLHRDRGGSLQERGGKE